MALVIRSSGVTRTDRAAAALNRKVPGVEQPPLLWPRWVQTGPGRGKTVMVPIPWDRIPPGWQAVRASVPMRLATCEETDCSMFLGGWTEILTADGNRSTKAGLISEGEAVAQFGLYGPKEIPPARIEHPAGTACPRIHKVPSGLPPIYQVDGRPVLWNEFEDALAGGIHQAQRLHATGH